jgi:ribulose-phosphate 3-epimerase
MCADFLHIEEEIKRLEQAGVDLLHFDIMDGHFVPNLTMGPDMVKAVRRNTNLPLDVHMMVSNPERYIDVFSRCSTRTGLISIHVEATTNIKHALRMIRSCGMESAIALNPATPISEVGPLLKEVAMVLIMTVEPGFAGQKLIPETVGKVRELKNILSKRKSNVEIEVDGNVSFENAPEMIRSGASVLVAGTSSLFRRGVTFQEGIKRLKGTGR